MSGLKSGEQFENLEVQIYFNVQWFRRWYMNIFISPLDCIIEQCTPVQPYYIFISLRIRFLHLQWISTRHTLKQCCQNRNFHGLSSKSGLTLHDFRRTTDQIGCDMSRRVIAGNRGKWLTSGPLRWTISHYTTDFQRLRKISQFTAMSQKFLNMFKTLRRPAIPSNC